jgi:CRISPR-associated protein Csm3
MEQLHKKITIKGNIKIITGLHIGGTNTQMGIGGPDKLVVRNPLSQLPIIPGSSLKGKMRALLELTKGKYGEGGKVGSDPEITALFGSSADKSGVASRLLVRDAVLSNTEHKNWENTDILYTESKTEVDINRLTSKANPRTFERVPAGAYFSFEMVVNIISDLNDVANTEEKLCKLLSEGLQLIEKDYLGGNGSRGYGQIKFEDLEVKELCFPSMEEKESAQKNKFIF